MTTQNTIEENKRIVREFIETAFNQHEADKAAALLTPDMKWHGGTLGTVEGRENVAGLVRTIVDALPDLHNVERDIIAERDIVAVRAVVEATHEGDLLGIPASGRHVQWDAVDVYRVADGKIEADEVGASLKWATAKIERASQRGNGHRDQGRERAAERGGDFNDQPPF